MIIHFDMDGVLVDYPVHMDDNQPPGFFLEMPPMPGAIEAFNRLSEQHDCYILSTAPWGSPEAWKEKRLWVEKHLGGVATKRLTLTHHKELIRGDILIDDRTKNGADGFQGKHIHFGQPGFENWEKVLAYLNTYDEDTEGLLPSLYKAVDKKLKNCDSDAFPTICQMRNTPEGLDMVRKYVAELIISNDNLSVMQAILLTEQQYSINSTN